MTKAEADELVADLEAIGVEVRRVVQNQLTGSWEVVYWHKGWRIELVPQGRARQEGPEVSATSSAASPSSPPAVSRHGFR